MGLGSMGRVRQQGCGRLFMISSSVAGRASETGGGSQGLEKFGL